MTAKGGTVPKFALGAFAFVLFLGASLATFPAAAQQAPVVVGGSGGDPVVVDLSVLDELDRPPRRSGELLFPGERLPPDAPITLRPPGTRLSLKQPSRRSRTAAKRKRPVLRAPKRQPHHAAKRPPAPRPTVKKTARKKMVRKKMVRKKTARKKATRKKATRKTPPAKPARARRPPRPVTPMVSPPPPPPAPAPPAERASAPKSKQAKPPLAAPRNVGRGSQKTPPVAAAPRTAVKQQTLPTSAPPPPPPPEAKRAPPPKAKRAPAAKAKRAPQTAALPKAPVPKGFAAGTSHRLLFKAGASTIPAGGSALLKKIAKALAANPALRLQLRAYAAPDGTSASRARRLSLSRALAIRSELIREKVKSTRIDVRALGSKATDGPPDRVDLAIVSR